MRTWLRDPATQGTVLFVVVLSAGFAGIALGWRVAARTLFVPFQVPAVVSGGLGGLALVLIGAGLLSVHAGRSLAAQERAAFEELLDEAAGLVDDVRGRP